MDYAARIADDKDPLRRILETARAWGVPPSKFLGAKTITTYCYDTAQRVVRSETQEWTADDVDMALALADFEARLCSGCRDDLAETTKRETYVGKKVGRCHKCTALEIAQEQARDDWRPSSLLFSAELREPETT